MKRASVTDAKNRLSALLERVRHGESILIEDRGVPVARLVPVVSGRGLPDRDAVARLERQGILRPPAVATPSRALQARPPRPTRAVALSQLVVAERREGW
jgi:prevent-host-death family protein